ncbi:MAG TPA: acyl carrier protein [Saprospiraceae bacterium]|nr:acyl carrier protein [Saprospiraceae bacterium]HMQ82649.1 acyl carrier protein [Saprospiraceae bacterium]
MESIKQAIRAYIEENFFQGQTGVLQDDQALLSSGIIDSVSALQLVSFIEEQFGIEFQAHEVDEENLNTVDTIVNFINSKRA